MCGIYMWLFEKLCWIFPRLSEYRSAARRRLYAKAFPCWEEEETRGGTTLTLGSNTIDIIQRVCRAEKKVRAAVAEHCNQTIAEPADCSVDYTIP
jgi:hypothetical protein